jgi:hypothetical protein
VAAAIVIGLMTWTFTMAVAPRHSPTGDVRNADLFWPLIAIEAALAGLTSPPRRAAVLGAALVLPGLLLSPWTTPRGDDDGLWILVVPLLAIFMWAMAIEAAAVSWLATRLRRRS